MLYSYYINQPENKMTANITQYAKEQSDNARIAASALNEVEALLSFDLTADQMKAEIAKILEARKANLAAVRAAY